MHGSNTIGAQLAPALAEAFLRKQGAIDVKTVVRALDEMTVQGTFSGDQPSKLIEIAAHGSATAFADLKNNKCDIGNASRQIKPEEVADLSKLGDMLSQGSEHVLGLDGIAMIVHASNPLASLSLSKEQIHRIFDGDLTDWKDVGRAQPGFINVYARDEKSGTWDTFKALVLVNSPLTPTAKRFEDSRQLSDLVANDPNGIGFVGLPYVRNAKAVAVSDAGSRPLFPNSLTVATEDYALSRRLYLYTASNSQNAITRDFVSFSLSKEGQDIVAKNGFVGQTTDPVKVSIPDNAPPEYSKLTAGAARLPLDFRFRSGNSTLDSKALDDLGRVVAFVSSPQYSGEKILLLGFADNLGSQQRNCLLSQDRAQSVAQQFNIRGIKTSSVTGLCSNLPVASNDTAQGREKNRRVEVWLRK